MRFGHLVRMPTGRLPWEVFQARPVGRRPRGRPRTRWRDYISTLAWERLGIPPSELVNVAREREGAWLAERSCASLLGSSSSNLPGPSSQPAPCLSSLLLPHQQ
ncbi:unnamed protein product [Pleuronectes platessa]|uniref:Uncharacterized protein n=1 Tax=Pleuronectes platessa TaxID=8262 RepID=A0A9N7ZAY6_PLEPL|nr:unnamed protein product [Pleuronectes platessa]